MHFFKEIQKWNECCHAILQPEIVRYPQHPNLGLEWGIWSEEEVGENLLHAPQGRREEFLGSEAIPPLSLPSILLWNCCREQSLLMPLYALCQQNFQEIWINSDLAAVLNGTPWAWCELGRCPSHGHILLTLVYVSFGAEVRNSLKCGVRHKLKWHQWLPD